MDRKLDLVSTEPYFPFDKIDSWAGSSFLSILSSANGVMDPEFFLWVLFQRFGRRKEAASSENRKRIKFRLKALFMGGYAEGG